jgi:hypothetical protein
MKTFSSLLFILLLTTLTASKPPEQANVTIGTYGIYPNSSTILIELKLNDDFTFNYVNNANLTKPVNTKGNWKVIGNTIELENFKSAFPINTKWTIDKDQPCLKSRKGLEFTRICLLSTAN